MPVRVRSAHLPLGGQEWLTPLEHAWVVEVLHNLGSRAKVFSTASFNAPGATDLPWHVGGVRHLELGTLLREWRLGPMPFIPAGGKALGMTRAVFSTVGEAFERVHPVLYGLNPVEGTVRVGTYRDLVKDGLRPLEPERLALFHPQQYRIPAFPYVPFSPDLRLTWMRGRELFTGEEVWAPAQVIGMGFPVGDEPRIGYASSAGLCAAPDWTTAAIRSCMEFMERDANNIRWVSGIPPYRIELSLRRALELVGLETALDSEWFQFDAFLWPTDVRGVCVVTAHLIHRGLTRCGYWPGIGVGLDFVTALRGALGECAQAQMFLSVMYQMEKVFGRHPSFYHVREDEDPSHIDNLFKTVVYYGYPANLQRIYRNFFDRARVIALSELDRWEIPLKLDAPPSPQELFARIRRIAEAHGLRPIVFEMTPREVAGRVTIAKVIILELTPYYSVRYPLFGHPRYESAPAVLGDGNRCLGFEAFNMAPIPYP